MMSKTPECWGDHEEDTGSCQDCPNEKGCALETKRRHDKGYVKTNRELLIELRGKYPEIFKMVKSYRDSNIALKSENEKLRDNIVGCVNAVNKADLRDSLSRNALREIRDVVLKYGNLCPVMFKTEPIFKEILKIVEGVDVDVDNKKRG